MTVSVPDTITPGGEFPVARAQDVALANGSTVETGLSAIAGSAAKGEYFESTDPAAASFRTLPGIPVLDAVGHLMGLIPPGPIDLSQMPVAEPAESTMPTVTPLLVDAAGRILIPGSDPNIPKRLAASEASLAGLASLVGPGVPTIEVLERTFEPGSTAQVPLVVDAAGRVLLWAGDPSAVAALSAAIAAQAARMDVYHDPSGAPDVQTYQPWRLRRARMKLRMLTPGVAVPGTQLSMTFCGDSYIDDSPKWLKKFADIMFAKYGRAAIGYVGFATTVQLVGWRKGFPDYVTVIDGTATSPDTYSVKSSTVGLLGEWFIGANEPRPTSARMLWNGTADGVIRYRWAAGDAWKSLNVQGAGVQSVLLNLAGMPALGSEIQLVIEVVAGTADLYGNYYAGSGTGLIINKCGNNGTRASGWAALDQAAWVAAISLIPTDELAFCLSTNDNSDGRSDVQLTGDVATLMRRGRLAFPSVGQTPGCDLLMILPEDIVPHYATKPIIRYTRAMRALAPTLDCAVVSMGYSFGSDPTVYRGWLDDTGYHPHQDTGAWLAADPILQIHNA